jgi:hypothetical protein
MCLCHMSFFSRRGDTHSSDDFDNYSTLGHKNTIRPWSQSPPQEIITSLWQLPQYGYDLSNDSQETLSSTSSNYSDSSVSAVYGDEDSVISSYDDGSISPQDAIELGESSDSGSIISQTSSTRATRRSSRATSPLMSDGVSHHATHNMNTPQRHRAAYHNYNPAKSPLTNPVIISGSSPNRINEKTRSKSLPDPSTISTTGRSAEFGPQSQLHKASSLLTQDPANSQLNESCCIGVLSAFEESQLGEEDKQAILQGGCHGLCGSQLSTIAIEPGDDKVNDSDGCKSPPDIRGPHQKRARFVSSMPSSIIAPVRCGTTPIQLPFPHRRVAAQYKQPRQPLPLAERPIRRVRFAAAPTPAQPEPRKINEHSAILPSCLKTTSAGQTVTSGLTRYNGPTTVQAKHDPKRQNFKGVINEYVLGQGASNRKTDESNSHDKNKSSRGRKLWGRVSALF